MTILHRLRLAARRAGFDISRWPAESSERVIHTALVSGGPDVILDVGANRGAYALGCRAFGYTGDIISFEPLAQAYRLLSEASRHDARWQAVRAALGSSTGSATLHVAANEGASSSILPMLDTHRVAAPDARFVREERVQVITLDDWVATYGRGWQNIALKLDVQGFEPEVLRGSVVTLPRIRTIRIEVNTTHLYEGDWLWTEAAEWMHDRGFRLCGVAPGFVDSETGRMLQFDAVFARDL